MNFLKKKDPELSSSETSAKKSFLGKTKTKYGTYAIVISAIVIAAAIAVNVIFGALSRRMHLDVDISLKGDNTLTKENIEFIQSLEVPVTITVCASKTGYLNDLDYYTGQSFGLTVSGKDYYAQTVTLLEYYDEYSDQITLEFIDFQDPEFNEIISEYGNLGFNYGDIIVTATHKMADGTDNVRNTIVAFDDIYRITDPYAYYYGSSSGTNIIGGNDVENAVSAAIRKVASTDTKKVGVIATHCSPSTVSFYESMLEVNNFEVEQIKDQIITEVSDDYSILVIAAPTADFAVDELDAIEEWLYNKGERGRGLLFFASVTSPELPNLYGKLEEWGIVVEDGILFDTNDFYHYAGDPMTTSFTKNNTGESTSENEIINQMTSGASAFAVGSGVPLSIIPDPKANTSVFIPIYSSSAEVVVAPKGAGVNWKPTDDEVAARHNGIVVSMEEEWENNEASRSYIVAFSSYSFISEEMFSRYGKQDNIHAAVNIANVVVGNEEIKFYFDTKKFTEVGYTVTDKTAKTMLGITIAVPLLVIAAGVFVFIRRRRR